MDLNIKANYFQKNTNKIHQRTHSENEKAKLLENKDKEKTKSNRNKIFKINQFEKLNISLMHQYNPRNFSEKKLNLFFFIRGSELFIRKKEYFTTFDVENYQPKYHIFLFIVMGEYIFLDPKKTIV